MAERRRQTRPRRRAVGVTRRTFLRGAALGGAALRRALRSRLGRSAVVGEGGAYVPQPNPTQYVIAVGRTSINPDGAQSVPAVLGNGTLPGPEIRVQRVTSCACSSRTAARLRDVDPLARLARAGGDGRRSGHLERADRSGPHVHLRVSDPANRHVLVPLPRRLPGAAGLLRRLHHRAAPRAAPRGARRGRAARRLVASQSRARCSPNFVAASHAMGAMKTGRAARTWTANTQGCDPTAA